MKILNFSLCNHSVIILRHVDGEGSASTIEEEEDILDAGNVDFTVTEDDTANSRASPVVIAALNE